MDSPTASVFSLPELKDVFPGCSSYEELYNFSINEVRMFKALFVNRILLTTHVELRRSYRQPCVYKYLKVKNKVVARGQIKYLTMWLYVCMRARQLITYFIWN